MRGVRNFHEVLAAEIPAPELEWVPRKGGVMSAPESVEPRTPDGSLLAFCFTGACHEMGAASSNVMPRPATVLVKGSQASLVRRAETVEEILSRDIIPDYLRQPPIGATP